jgi:SUZ domain
MDRIASSENEPVGALSSEPVTLNAPVAIPNTGIAESSAADVANDTGNSSTPQGSKMNSRDEGFSHYDRKSYHFENSNTNNPKMYVRSHSAGTPVTHRLPYINPPMDPNQMYYDMNHYYPPPYHGSQLYNNNSNGNQYSAPMRRRPSPTYNRHNNVYYPQGNYAHGPALQQPYPPALNGYMPQQPMQYEPTTAKYSRNSTPPTNSNIDNASTVDSALLSALLNDDMEECWALLRLEQTLIEFVQNTTTGWMEVGGPYNSVILYASSSTSSENLTNTTETNDSRISRSPNAETSHQVVSNNTHATSNPRMSQPPPQPQYTFQQQTTFQRCVLHRLADRFNIIREPGRSSCHTSNMLRLIKMPNTCIPKISLAEYYHKYIVSSQSNEDVGEGTTDPTEGLMASMSLSEVDPEGLDPPTPLKIMKRTSSQSSSKKHKEQDLKMSASSASSTLDSNYEDKERAYAEARARIFQDSEASAVTVDPENDAANPDTDQRWMADESAVDPQSKAVYRNRYQEVADPDFQRFHSTRRNMHPSPYPMRPDGTPYMNAPEYPGGWALPPPYHPYPPVAPPSFADPGAFPPLPPPHPEERLERVASAPAKLKAAAPEFVPRWQQP